MVNATHFAHNNLASFSAHLKEKHNKKSCSKAHVEPDKSESDDKSEEKEVEEEGSGSSSDSDESEEDSPCGSGG